MVEIKDEGICRFCLKTFAGRSMGRHLRACQAKKSIDSQRRATDKKLRSIYHLKIWGYKPFWLHIEAASTVTLSQLDGFLRNICFPPFTTVHAAFTTHGRRKPYCIDGFKLLAITPLRLRLQDNCVLHLTFPVNSQLSSRFLMAHLSHVSSLSTWVSQKKKDLPYPSGYQFPVPFGRRHSL